jgi:Fuc2NAc and GlcNAc transferase
MNPCWLLLPAALVSGLLTGLLRRYAMARSVLDVPNDRSSHSVPTPRGGGVAIVLPFLAGVALMAVEGVVSRSIAFGLIGGGSMVALVGFLDDHRPIRVGWRLLAHFSAAAWVLAWLGGMPAVDFLGVSARTGWLGNVLGAVYLVWLLNLYNFMDGIDGIAALEAVTVGVGVSLLYLLRLRAGQEWLVPALLAMAALGFLVWNWPRARIFMGDAGSGFLGLTLGAMSVRAGWLGSELLWSWVILLGVFVVDATVTLLRRADRGEKVHEAHRDHGYQHAASRMGAHQPVTVAVGLINVFWLLPLALLVGLGLLGGLFGVVIAYAPLVGTAVWLKAGEPSPA